MPNDLTVQAFMDRFDAWITSYPNRAARNLDIFNVVVYSDQIGGTVAGQWHVIKSDPENTRLNTGSASINPRAITIKAKESDFLDLVNGRVGHIKMAVMGKIKFGKRSEIMKFLRVWKDVRDIHILGRTNDAPNR